MLASCESVVSCLSAASKPWDDMVEGRPISSRELITAISTMLGNRSYRSCILERYWAWFLYRLDYQFNLYSVISNSSLITRKTPTLAFAIVSLNSVNGNDDIPVRRNNILYDISNCEHAHSFLINATFIAFLTPLILTHADGAGGTAAAFSTKNLAGVNTE